MFASVGCAIAAIAIVSPFRDSSWFCTYVITIWDKSGKACASDDRKGEAIKQK